MFTADPGATVSLALWAAQGGVMNNFSGAAVTGTATQLDQFSLLGFSGTAPTCYQGTTIAGQNCLLLAETSGPLPGTGFSIDDSGNESADNITFTVATEFTDKSWAVGSANFFVSPPDPSSFGLVVISG